MWGEVSGNRNYWALLILSLPWKNGVFVGKDLSLKEQCHHLLYLWFSVTPFSPL